MYVRSIYLLSIIIITIYCIFYLQSYTKYQLYILNIHLTFFVRVNLANFCLHSKIMTTFENDSSKYIFDNVSVEMVGNELLWCNWGILIKKNDLILDDNDFPLEKWISLFISNWALTTSQMEM